MSRKDRSKRSGSQDLARGDALLWGFGMALLGYTFLVPHTFSHLLHWALSGATGLWGFLTWSAWVRFGGKWQGKTVGQILDERRRRKEAERLGRAV